MAFRIRYGIFLTPARASVCSTNGFRFCTRNAESPLRRNVLSRSSSLKYQLLGTRIPVYGTSLFSTQQSDYVNMNNRYSTDATTGNDESSKPSQLGTAASKKQRNPSQVTPAEALDFRRFQGTLFEQLSRGSDMVTLEQLQRELSLCGLRKTDPRLCNSFQRFNESERYSDDSSAFRTKLDRETFSKYISDNIVLIRDALTGELVIPDFERFCRDIEVIYHNSRKETGGKVADYIPQLSKYSPDFWAVSLCTVDGQRYSIGDVKVPFTIQSSGKPFNYALALDEFGEEVVHKYVGFEPSGEAFNKLKLNPQNKPHNPLINAGAIIIASLLTNKQSLADRFDHILTQYSRLSGGEFVGFSNSVFLSEKATANRNLAIGYYMNEKKCFPPGINFQDSLDLYFQLCSIEVNAESGAVMAASLANGGYCPITGKEVLRPDSVRNTLSLMYSCGMYDYSGEFAFKIGLPAKSSVSGAIMLVIPNVMGLCLWSPPLDQTGNSVRGVQFAKDLIREFSFHNYDNLKHTLKKRDPRMNRHEVLSNLVVQLLMCAYHGDMSSLRRIALLGADMTVADYDGRTALHLAAAEGHLECTKFLIELCGLSPFVKDRWHRTPYDDAKMFNKTDVAEYLMKKMEK